MEDVTMYDVLASGSRGRLDGSMPMLSSDEITSLPPGWGVNTFVDGYQAHNRKSGSSRQVTYVSKDFSAVCREVHRIASYVKTRIPVAPASSLSQMSVFDILSPDVPDDMPF